MFPIKHTSVDSASSLTDTFGVMKDNSITVHKRFILTKLYCISIIIYSVMNKIILLLAMLKLILIKSSSLVTSDSFVYSTL